MTAALLAASALVLAGPAWADGGAGGGASTGTGGAGGSGFNGAPGALGGSGGGGGGGAAVGDGSDGSGDGGAGNGGANTGGAGGTASSRDGGPGQSDTNNPGGGGGGGFSGNDPTTGDLANSSMLQGGRGGNGGSTSTTVGAGGGGGGGAGAIGNGTGTSTNAGQITGGDGGGGGTVNNQSGTVGGGGSGGGGGFGVLLTGSGVSFHDTGSGVIFGGAGGNGGAGPSASGSGGNGGDALRLLNTGTVTVDGYIQGGAGGRGGDQGISGSSANAPGNIGAGGNGGNGVTMLGGGTLTNNGGSILGGDGATGGTYLGTAGTGTGTAGAGGVGVTGANLAIVNSGTISGGLGGDGVTRANAITFTSGVNSLELRQGSNITGNVVAASVLDTLIFGGATDSIFDVSRVGAGQQYQNFLRYQKSGTSTWVLTGSLASASVQHWTLQGGFLAITSIDALNVGSFVTFDGGGLRFDSAMTFAPTNTMTLQAGGASFDTNGHDVTLSGIANGTGGITKLGAGTLTLIGSNTYTGDTNINAGTLKAGGILGLSTNSMFNVASGAALDLNGTIQDIGGLTGAGLVTNSLADRARLMTGEKNVSSTFSGTIEDGAGRTALWVSGNTNGPAFTFTLTGTNTYTGGTAICSCATLQLGNGGTGGSIVGDVTNGGTLAFNRSDTYTFNGAISDSGTDRGQVVQEGTGTTILTAINTYSGDTNINAGTLEIDGWVTQSNVIVNNGGTLSGTGKIGDPTIKSGGTLMPGSQANPYGTLGIAGPLTFEAGSFFAVRAAADGRNAAVSVFSPAGAPGTGVVTIAGGTVTILADSSTGQYRTGQTYSILTADQVTGRFTGATANFAFLTPTLTYSATGIGVTLTVRTPATPGSPPGGATPNYRTAAGTPNQSAVAGGLTNGGVADGDGGPVLTAFNQLSVAQAQAAFDSVSGEGIVAAQNLAFRTAALFQDAMFDQTVGVASTNSVTLTAPAPGPVVHELADLPSRRFDPPAPPVRERSWRAWGTGFGATDNIAGRSEVGSVSEQASLYGGAMGVDRALSPNLIVGAAVGGSDGTFDVQGRVTSGRVTGGHIGTYSLATFGSFYGAGSTTFSYFTNSTTRVAGGFGGLGGETLNGRFDSHEVRTRLEFGRNVVAYAGTLTPFIALDIAQLRTDGFGETALSGPGNLRLAVDGQSIGSVPGTIGLRYRGNVGLGGLLFRPLVEAAWVHEFAPQRNVTAQFATLPDSTFIVEGAGPSRDAARVKAGGELALNERMALFASFNGEFSGVERLYAGSGGIRLVW